MKLKKAKLLLLPAAIMVLISIACSSNVDSGANITAPPLSSETEASDLLQETGNELDDSISIEKDSLSDWPHDDELVPKEMWGNWIEHDIAIMTLCSSLQVYYNDVNSCTDGNYYDRTDLKDVTYGYARNFSDRLGLQGNGLTFPPIMSEFKSLKFLWFASAIDELDLSENLCELSQLEKLYIDFAIVKTMPKEIHKLKNLKELRIQRSYIEELPDEFFDLTNLEILKISHYSKVDDGNIEKEHALHELSPEIKRLVNLKELDLSNNDISSLPDELWELKNLKELDVRNNSIKAYNLPTNNTNLLIIY